MRHSILSKPILSVPLAKLHDAWLAFTISSGEGRRSYFKACLTGCGIGVAASVALIVKILEILEKTSREVASPSVDTQLSQTAIGLACIFFSIGLIMSFLPLALEMDGLTSKLRKIEEAFASNKDAVLSRKFPRLLSVIETACHTLSLLPFYFGCVALGIGLWHTPALTLFRGFVG